MIRVAGNIAYEDAQAAIDAAGEERTDVSSSPCSMPEVEGPVPAELVETALKPLWSCWEALFAARNRREPLELDLPERQVVLDEKGESLGSAAFANVLGRWRDDGVREARFLIGAADGFSDAERAEDGGEVALGFAGDEVQRARDADRRGDRRGQPLWRAGPAHRPFRRMDADRADL